MPRIARRGNTAFTERERRIALAAACLAAFVSPLTGAAITLSLNDIGSDLGCTAQQLSWLTSAYFVFTVPMMIPAARLADIYGKKRVFIIGAAIGAAALMATAIVENPMQFYVARAFTAVGAACITGTSVSVIVEAFPEEGRPSALAYFTACTFIGDTAGPSMGGFVTSYLGWRANFPIIAAFFIVGILLMRTIPHRMAHDPEGSFNGRGSLIFAAGMVTAMVGAMGIPRGYGFAMLAAGLSILVLFAVEERRSPHPVMRISLFRNSGFMRSIAVLVLCYVSTYSLLFFLSLYLEDVRGMAPSEASLLLMVQPAVQTAAILASGRISGRLDPRILPAAGMAVLAMGFAVLAALIGAESDLLLLACALAVVGAGFGVFVSPNLSAAMSCVGEGDRNGASALYGVSRHIGIAISMCMASCLIAVHIGTTASLSPEDGGLLLHIMRDAWWMCSACCAAGALLSWSGAAPRAVERRGRAHLVRPRPAVAGGVPSVIRGYIYIS